MGTTKKLRPCQPGAPRRGSVVPDVQEAGAEVHTAMQATPQLLASKVGLHPTREASARHAARALVAAGYELGAAIGSGGMGMVYRGTDRSTGAPVAIKILRAELLEGEGHAERLRAEGRALRAIRHPGVVTLLDAGELPDGRPYLVMPLLQGRSLEWRLQAQQRLPPEEVARVLAAILDALGAAHRVGLLHRDIKPSNVLLPAGGAPRAVLLDFGLAKALGAGGQSSASRHLVGTPGFMSPEQICSAPQDARSDLYSAGVLAFTALTGRRPFQRATVVEELIGHLERPPVPPSSLVSGIPPELDRLVLKLMQKDPAQRPATAQQARLALFGAPTVQELPRVAVTVTETAVRPVQGRRLRAAALVLAVTALSMGVGRTAAQWRRGAGWESAPPPATSLVARAERERAAHASLSVTAEARTARDTAYSSRPDGAARGAALLAQIERLLRSPDGSDDRLARALLLRVRERALSHPDGEALARVESTLADWEALYGGRR